MTFPCVCACVCVCVCVCVGVGVGVGVCMRVCERPNFPFCKDTSHIRDPPLDLMLIISAEILFPNKATSTGTGGQDFKISFGGGARCATQPKAARFGSPVPSTKSEPE